MNLILRLIRVVISALLKSRKARMDLFDVSEVRFRVLPTDLDINMHMNNARYLSFMDLGRTDLLIRAGLFEPVRRHRWMAVVGGIEIKFRRPLNPFKRFTLKTRLLYWDKKWFYMEQRLESERGVHAIAHVRGLFVGKEGSVPTDRVIEAMGIQVESPPIPESMSRFSLSGRPDARLRTAN